VSRHRTPAGKRTKREGGVGASLAALVGAAGRVESLSGVCSPSQRSAARLTARAGSQLLFISSKSSTSLNHRLRAHRHA
jgi:hypothetical protein